MFMLVDDFVRVLPLSFAFLAFLFRLSLASSSCFSFGKGRGDKTVAELDQFLFIVGIYSIHQPLTRRHGVWNGKQLG